MAVSGRAGLFTIDDRFFTDLRGMPYTAEKRQKSGALRLEFGKFNVPDGTATASVRMTINTGIMALVTPAKVPTITANASGGWACGASGSFLSGYLHVDVVATGQFSGEFNGADINYLVVGY